MRVSVYPRGEPVTGGVVAFDDLNWPLVTGVLEPIDDLIRIRFDCPPEAVYGWHVHLVVYTTTRTIPFDVTFAPDVDVECPPDTVLMPALTIDGQFFRSGGQRFTGIDRSLFQAYERLLRGESLDAVLSQGQSFGFNMGRVFGLNTSVHHLLPWEWPNYYEDLPKLASAFARFDHYLNFVVFTQTDTLMPVPDQQVEHLRRVMQALHDVPCLISKVNEHDQHDNKISDQALAVQKPASAKFLLSNGSNGAGSLTVSPMLEWGEYHTNDLFQWQRKSGHGPYEKVSVPNGHRPAGSTENTRSDNDHFDLKHAYDSGASAALLCAEACCHTPEGKLALPFNESAAWAKAWADGAHSVPLDYQPGEYKHRDDLENAAILRVYQRVVGGLPPEPGIVKVRY